LEWSEQIQQSRAAEQDQPGLLVGGPSKQPFVITAPVHFAEVPPVELSPPVFEPGPPPVVSPLAPAPPVPVNEAPPVGGVTLDDPAEPPVRTVADPPVGHTSPPVENEPAGLAAEAPPVELAPPVTGRLAASTEAPALAGGGSGEASNAGPEQPMTMRGIIAKSRIVSLQSPAARGTGRWVDPKLCRAWSPSCRPWRRSLAE
jgi:hypothetical protein